MLKYDLTKQDRAGWLIAETDFDIDHQGKCEAIFCQGNGYLGQRAALEEPYVGQTRDLLAAGTFNRFDEAEVCELPNLPDLTNLRMRMNGHPFAMDRGETSDYLRILDLETGEITRTLTWTAPDGASYRLRFERFVSLAQEHLLGFRVQVTPLDGELSLTVESGIDGRMTNGGSQHFHEGEKRMMGDVLRMVSETTQSGVTCCLHAAFRWFTDGKETAPETLLPVIDRRCLGVKAVLKAGKGSTITVEKLCAVTTSRDRELEGAPDAAEKAAETGLAVLREALKQGYRRAADESAARWAAFWQDADVRVESSRPMDQLMLRFALYHLNIMAKKNDPRVGIAAKGLTGEGYKGHSFWDTEIFILPYFVLTRPEDARNLLKYRWMGLYGARKKAAENGFEGAMYPWEAAWFDDGEVTPLWGAADIVTGEQIPILTGLIEQHITADVAFGVDLYFAATGDQAFMDDFGYEILIDTARFWASRLTWDEERQAYVILDVIGPDEYKDHVDNNAYTNYMAAHNLRLGLKAIAALEGRKDEVRDRLDRKLHFKDSEKKLRDALAKIYLPAPDAEGIVPQFDGYFQLKPVDLTRYKNAAKVGQIYDDYNPEQLNRMQVHKQADTLALMLLLDDLFPKDIKLKNFDFYEARTLHDSSLSKSTHCVLAADLGETDLAYRFYTGCGEIDLGPNMGTSDMGIHAASVGGIWQCAVYGFGGVRVSDGELHVAPHLPKAWTRLTFPLMWQGQRLAFSVTPEGTEIRNLGTRPVRIRLYGQDTTVRPE